MQNANLDAYNIALALTESYFSKVSGSYLTRNNPNKSMIEIWNETYDSFFENVTKHIDAENQ